jgi:hypothetical protein
MSCKDHMGEGKSPGFIGCSTACSRWVARTSNKRERKQFAAAEPMQKRPVSSVFQPPPAGGMHRRLRMGEELERRECKKSSFIGSSTACIRWRAPATEELQRSGCK